MTSRVIVAALVGLSASASAGPLRNFGTGISAGTINGTETELLHYNLSSTGEVRQPTVL